MIFQKPSPSIALEDNNTKSEEYTSRVADDVETIVGPSVNVEGDFGNKQSAALETPAYIISILATLVLMICIIFDFKFKE